MNHVNDPALAAIQIAVVGHTNTGKTSLIRTLLRSQSFGVIEDSAGTTRHVERAALLVDGEAVIEMFDTPGLEDSDALLDALDKVSDKSSGVETIQQFLDSQLAQEDLAQEAKVLRQGLRSDALLYVVDIRAPQLEKYSDEIKILSRLGIPIIPVFNFIGEQASQLQQWRAVMVSHNLHAALEFDTVAFSFEAEKRLYQKLQGVLEQHYERIQGLIEQRQTDWLKQLDAAVRRSVKLLADCASLRLEPGEEGAADQDKQRLQNQVRELEQSGLRDLLRLFSFSKTDVQLAQLPVSDDDWEFDLFSSDTLKMFGLDARSSALKGAAAGAGLDLMVGGLSLGMATAIGALAGAGYSTVKRYGKDIASVFSDDGGLCADDVTIELLAFRQYELLQGLTCRGHASQGATQVDKMAQASRPDTPEQWSKIITGLRSGQVNRGESNPAFSQSQQQLTDWLRTATQGDAKQPV
ncbi:MAG: GTPase/DUF3482 domain-containing protein [Pseudomonadales bacterium]